MISKTMHFWGFLNQNANIREKGGIKVFMDDGSSPLRGLIVLVICILLNGIFYGFSSAIHNLSESEMEKKASEGDKKAQYIFRILENPAMLVNTIPVVVILTSILFGMIGVKDFVNVLLPYMQNIVAVIISVCVSIVFLVALGVLAFRKVCRYHAESSAYLFIRPVRLLTGVLSPLIWITAKLSNLIVMLFGIDPHKIGEDVTEEDLISVVDEAHEQGVIEENEAEMIQNIIDFGDKEAKDIMTHRKNIIALDADTILEGAIDIMVMESNSRYPVYEENIDNIIGIVHLKDVLKVLTEDALARQKAIRDIRGLVREVSYIPETRNISDIFEAMQAKKIHMVIVVDEYGQTAGLVAMEDILEEIVGEIQDEYDEEEVNIRAQYDNSLLIDGMTPLEDVGEELGLDFEEEEFETLNGFLTDCLGHIPKKEDREVQARGYRFQILSIKNNTIQQVRAEKIQENEEGEKQCQDIQNLPT